MTDRPIPFSAPMIGALMREVRRPGSGKTETRRVIVPRHEHSLFDGSRSDSYVLDLGNKEWRDRDVRYAAGDRLWVREAWKAEARYDDRKPRDIPRGAPIYPLEQPSEPTPECAGRFRHGRFMPRWASRLTLLVDQVLVERLHDIDDAGAEREGIYRRDAVGDDPASACWTSRPTGWRYDTPRQAYAALWDELHGRGAWDADPHSNPWVAVIRFRPLLVNIDDAPAALGP